LNYASSLLVLYAKGLTGSRLRQWIGNDL